MLVTNQTSQSYWFGPLQLPGGIGQELTVDDTSETSLYLLDDVVADALNNLWASGRVSVSDAAEPFPRPTGTPDLRHGDGSPEGLRYAPPGSLYLRRDGLGANNLYVKTTGVAFSTGWVLVAAPDPWSSMSADLGLLASTFPVHMSDVTGAPPSNNAHACGVHLNAGTLITGLVLNVLTAASALSVAYIGIYDANYELQAVSANATGLFGAAGWVEVPFTAPFQVPESGLYYFADIFAGTTTPGLACLNASSAQASQPSPSGLRPFWAGSGSDSTLIPTASPALTRQVHWIGAY